MSTAPTNHAKTPTAPDLQPTASPDLGCEVLITGVGQISALGQSAWETFRNLLAGRTASDRLAELPEGIGLLDTVKAVGAVKSVQHSATDPAVDLAERAAREAIQDAGMASFEGPVFLGTSKGCVSAWTAAAAKHLDPENHPHLHPQDAHLAAVLGPHGYLCHHLGKRLQTPVTRCTVAACASSLVALDTARRHLLAHPACPHALVVTSESALLPMFVESYRRLGVLCPAEAYRALPFAGEQHGFILGEQAAAVVLTRSDAITPTRPAKTWAKVLATANLTDPHDLIRSNPDGEAMHEVARQILAATAANGGPPACDALLAHAPGTQVHEAAELAAIRDTLGHTPAVYGLKGAVGHGLGASGLMAVVTACLCAKTKKLPPMPWLRDAPATCPTASPSGQALPDKPTVAIFAAGFAGHTAGALIQGC